jgi:hypothetical protein
LIPDIGVMIAAYIITRMAALLGQPSPEANVISKILAAITILVALFVSIDLVATGSRNIPNIR